MQNNYNNNDRRSIQTRSQEDEQKVRINKVKGKKSLLKQPKTRGMGKREDWGQVLYKQTKVKVVVFS